MQESCHALNSCSINGLGEITFCKTGLEKVDFGVSVQVQGVTHHLLCISYYFQLMGSNPVYLTHVTHGVSQPPKIQ